MLIAQLLDVVITSAFGQNRCGSNRCVGVVSFWDSLAALTNFGPHGKTIGSKWFPSTNSCIAAFMRSRQFIAHSFIQCFVA